MSELIIDIKKILKNVFAISLSSKNIVRKDIDTIFNKNKMTYMKYYKKSDIYKTVLNQSLNFETETYTEKVIGIIEYCLDTKDITDLENLYKKAFKKIYNNTKNLKNINFYNIFKYLSKGIESTYEAFSTFYIAYLNDKFDINGFANDDRLVSALKDIAFLEKYINTNFSDGAISAFKKDLVDISEKLGIKKKMYTLEELIDDILEKDVENYNKSIVAKGIANIHSIQKCGNVGKYIGAMEGTFKYLQIDSGRLSKNISFTQKEVNSILLNFVYAKKFNNFSDSNLAQTVINVIYITALKKEYKKLKDDYLKNINEEHLVEIDKLQNDLISSKNEFNRLTEKTKLKEQSLVEKEKDLITEIENLKKENSKLKIKLNEAEELRQEVVKLRNIVFNSEIEEEVSQPDITIDIKKLNEMKIVIIGGNINWVKKLKEQFPNWTYIGMEQLNNNFTNLKNIDFMFINTKMKHSLYFKIKTFISKFDIKYDYLEPSENISLNIESIYNKLCSELILK